MTGLGRYVHERDADPRFDGQLDLCELAPDRKVVHFAFVWELHLDIAYMRTIGGTQFALLSDLDNDRELAVRNREGIQQRRREDVGGDAVA